MKLRVSTLLVLSSLSSSIFAMNPLQMNKIGEAIFTKDIAKIKSLINEGANVNSQDIDKYTPLHVAAEKNDVDFINFLVSKGANVNVASTGAGWTPFESAIMKNSVDAMKALVKHGVRIQPVGKRFNRFLHLAVLSNAPAALKFLLESGLPVDVKDGSGSTPLHKAAFSGDTELIQILLKHGADISATNSHGETPLEIYKQSTESVKMNVAQSNERSEIMKLLSAKK